MDENSQLGGGTNPDFAETPSWYQDAVTTPPPPAPGQPGMAVPPAPGQAQVHGQNQWTPAPENGSLPGAPKKRSIGKALGVKAGIFGVLALVGLVATRGTTSAAALEVGDCFVMSDSTEIARVETPDCSEAHDSQVVGIVEVASVGEYPGDTDPYWDNVSDQCSGVAFTTITNGDLLPVDARMELFTPSEAGWGDGERESICIIHSPSGLSGSFVGVNS